MTTQAIEKNKEGIEQSTQTSTSTRVYRVAPAVDIYENENALVFIADMPGVAKEGLDLQVDRRELTMTGKVNDGYQYVRSFNLPSTIDVDKVSANLKNGVLQVTFEKAEAAKPKKIQVNLVE